MDNPIVGVRFVGPNERFIDKYFKTGAEWLIGTVHNFSLNLADKFFSYPCFERTDVSLDGNTFVASAGRSLPEVAPNINLHVMDTDRLVHLARYEFNRVINPEGKSVDQVRAEVRTLSVMRSLDLAEDEALTNVVRQISADELGVILHPSAVPEPILDAVIDEPAIQPDPEKGPDEESSPEAVIAGEVPVSEMNKVELAAFALEKFAVRLDKRTNVDDMRARIATLEERAAP